MRPDLQYFSTKTYTHSQGLSCCFRQHRADSHCKFLHGYALEVKLTFTATELDKNGWVQDFGDLKWAKAYLEETFDHKLLVAGSDPLLALFQTMHVQGMADILVFPHSEVGIEAFAERVFASLEYLVGTKSNGRVKLVEVEIKEHASNSAIVRRKR